MKKKKEDNSNEKIKVLKVILNKVSIIAILIVILCIVLALGVATKFQSQSAVTNFGLKNVGKFVTQTAYETIVKDTKEDKKLFNKYKIPFSESRIIFSYDVTVDAAIDFEQIKYDINKNEKQVKVTFPSAEIYKSTIDMKSEKVFLDTNALFSKLDETEKNNARIELEEEAIRKAKDAGIIEAANNNAKTLLEGLIKGNAKFKNYNVVFDVKGE